MKAEERVLELLARANPEPDETFDLDSDAATYLGTIQRGSSTVTQLETGPNKSEASSRNLMMGVAAALVAVVGVAVILLTTGDGATPPSSPDTPQDIALAFLEAKENYDTAAALALVDDDALVSVGPATNKEEIAFEIAFSEATGLVLAPEGCEQADGQLTCTAGVTTAITRARGFNADTFTYVFEVTGDRITEVRLINLGDYSAENWGPFHRWILLNHADDYEIMYNGSSEIAKSDESLALWETRTAEYVEEITNDVER